jgi:hypothetical protein
LLNLRPNENQRKVETHAEKKALIEYWRQHGLDLLREKNPTYSQCKAAAIGNQTENPELAADLMIKARKWRKWRNN